MMRVISELMVDAIRCDVSLMDVYMIPRTHDDEQVVPPKQTHKEGNSRCRNLQFPAMTEARTESNCVIFPDQTIAVCCRWQQKFGFKSTAK